MQVADFARRSTRPFIPPKLRTTESDVLGRGAGDAVSPPEKAISSYWEQSIFYQYKIYSALSEYVSGRNTAHSNPHSANAAQIPKIIA